MTGIAELRNWYEGAEYDNIRLWELYFFCLFLLNLLIIPTVYSIENLLLFIPLLGLVVLMDIFVTVAFYRLYRKVKDAKGLRRR